MSSTIDLNEQIKNKLIEYHQKIKDLTTDYEGHMDASLKGVIHFLAMKVNIGNEFISEIEEMLK